MEYKWEIRQKKSFEVLKKRFMTEPVLVMPDLDKEMRAEANTLDFSIGEVLLIKYEDEK